MRISGNIQQNIYNRNIYPIKISGGCPHGNPPGACPICLGMGGGGSAVKPKPTARELGLLTWADLLPVWYAMLAAKNRKEYEAIQQRLMDATKLAERTRLFQAVNDYISSKIIPVIKLIDTKIVSPVLKAVNAAIKALNSFYAEIKALILSQIDKAANFINEKLNIFMEKLKNSMEIFKTAMERFISELKEKDLKKDLKAFLKEVNKNLLGIIMAIDSSLEQHSDNENSEENRKSRGELSYEQ